MASQSIITTTGYTLLAQATIGTPLKISKFTLSSRNDYELDPDMAVLPDTVYTQELESQLTSVVLNANTVQFSIYLDTSIGDFAVGSVGLWDENDNLFAIGLLASVQAKRETTLTQSGNTLQFVLPFAVTDLGTGIVVTQSQLGVDNVTITVTPDNKLQAKVSPHSLFEVFQSASNEAPNGAFPLFTQTTLLSVDTVYPEFWSEALRRKAAGTIRVVSQATYDSEVALNGECTGFVIDETNKTIVLPLISGSVLSSGNTSTNLTAAKVIAQGSTYLSTRLPLWIQVFNGVSNAGVAQCNQFINAVNLLLDRVNDVSARLPIFFSKREPSKIIDLSWVCADDFQWCYKSTYKGAYNYLVGQYQPTGSFEEGDVYYTISFSNGEIETTDVTVASGTASDLQTWATNQGYTTTGSTIEDLVVSKTLVSTTETIGSSTITYYRTHDEKKIVLPDQENTVIEIYQATGVAEYFILDTVNAKFKLPRNKWGVYGTSAGSGGDYIEESLPNIVGHLGSYQAEYNRWEGAFWNPGGSGKGISSGGSGSNQAAFDASRSSPTYKDGAPVQPRGSQGYLYFYMGTVGADVLREIASIRVDSLAQKDLSNTPLVDYIVEQQLPTADNNYTWYNKYKSGRVEQGGICNNYNYQTIVLPVEMANKNYSIQLSERVINRTTATGGTANSQIIYDSCTTTSLYVYINNTAGTGAYWEVKGMAASN